MVKSLPTNTGDMRDSGLIAGWEDPERKRQPAAKSSAWRTPRTEELKGYSPWGHNKSDVTEVT